MRIAATLTGPGIGLFGFGQLAPETMDLAFLVGGMAGVTTARLRQTDRSPAGLLERLGPRAAELHDLRAVNQTGRGERHELRLRLAPPAERHRPFTRAIQRMGLLAGGNCVAVNQPCHDR